MAADFKARCKPCVSSPADAGYVIRFPVRTVDGDQKICNFSSQRRFPVNRFFTNIAVQINLIAFILFRFFLNKFQLSCKNGKHQPVFLFLMPVIGTELSGNIDELSLAALRRID